MRFGPFQFRIERGELTRDDEAIRLSEREREILTILALARGGNVEREALTGTNGAANERRRRADEPAAPAHRGRPGQPALRADPCAASATGGPGLKDVPAPPSPGRSRRPGGPGRRLGRVIGDRLPKGLYARSLIIIIAPMVLLQSVIAYTFMERHWQLVTRRLSAAVTADVAALIDIYESYPQDKGSETLERIASERSTSTSTSWRARSSRPRPAARSSRSSTRPCPTRSAARSRRPFWIDTVGRSSLIEIRVEIPGGVMRVIAGAAMPMPRTRTSSCSGWAAPRWCCSAVAILFLRNQIGRSCGSPTWRRASARARELDFRPRGAREVRKAGHAFIEMKRRIERAMEQRTTMLNGVSHDLRTIITRFGSPGAAAPRPPRSTTCNATSTR